MGGLEGGGGGGSTGVGVMEGVGPGTNVTGGGGVVTSSMDEIGGRQRNKVDSVT
jgi:hypothetical protein